jgi:hypothetical protein
MGMSMSLNEWQTIFQERLAANTRIMEAEKAAPGPEETGALVIEDDFLWSSDMESPNAPHGQIVQASAEQEGFKGKIYDRLPWTSRPGDEERLLRDSKVLHSAESGFLFALQDRTVCLESQALSANAAELQRLGNGGFQDGALNLSQAYSKQSYVLGLYREAIRPPSDPSQQSLVANYGRAFGFDPGDLSPSSSKVGEARSKLQQGLIAQVNRAVDGNAEVQKAKREYDAAVDRLSQSRVSVVVAGENGGTDIQYFAADGNGNAPRIPADYYLNPLSNSRTVTVGAVGSLRDAPGAAESIADYNSPVKDDVLALGITSDSRPHEGTSFSAPRVAAALAWIHGRQPGISNEQALQKLKSELTHPLQGDPSRLVLDPGKAARALSEQ